MCRDSAQAGQAAERRHPVPKATLRTHRALLAVVLSFVACAALMLRELRRAPPAHARDLDSVPRPKQGVSAPFPFLVISIGSRPTNFHLRKALRETWLGRVPAGDVEYRFFTELPPGDPETSAQLRREQLAHGDLVFQEISSGYNGFADRGLEQIQWVLDSFPNLQYYLRVDDDSFLCWDKFYWELKQRPRERFFWGKYWCLTRHRADENFMLFSADIIKFIHTGYSVGLFARSGDFTFAINYAKWSLVLNITSFDDRKRIDSQQRYLTRYMHSTDDEISTEEAGMFCSKYIYAHHVRSPAIMEKVFRASVTLDQNTPVRILPNITLHTETCSPRYQTFHVGKNFFFARETQAEVCDRRSRALQRKEARMRKRQIEEQMVENDTNAEDTLEYSNEYDDEV